MPANNDGYTYKYYSNSRYSTRIPHEVKVKREQAIDAFIAGASIEEAMRIGDFPSSFAWNTVILQLRKRGANIPKVASGTWRHYNTDIADTTVNEATGRRRYSDEVRERAIQLRGEGLTHEQVAKAVGVGSSRTIRVWCMEHDKKCT